ncbi:MAG: PAS domain S-box protein [Bacteroidia bacterium]|nr:PAS domain S-box protein [Bacteroidia bacterium]
MELTQKQSKEPSGLVIELNLEGFCVHTNKAIYAETGYLPQEIIGKKFKSFLEIDPNYLREVEQKLSSGSEQVVHFDCYFKHKLGSLLYMQWTMYWVESQNQVLCLGKVHGQTQNQITTENKELQLLNAIHENIHLHKNAEDLLEEVCKILIKTGNYSFAWISEIKGNQCEVLFKDSEQFVSDPIFKQSSLGSNLLKDFEITETIAEPRVIHVSAEQQRNLANSFKVALKSVLLIPIDLPQKHFIGIGSLDEKHFTNSKIQLFEKIRQRILFSIKSFKNEKLLVQRETDLNKYIRELNLLNEINNKILLIKDEKELIKEVLKTLNEQGNYKLSWIAFFDNEVSKKDVIVPNYSFGNDEYANQLRFDLSNPEILKGPAASCILTRKTAIVNSSQKDPNFSFWRENAKKHGLHSLTSLFLNISSKDKGILTVYAGDDEAFDYKEVIILERIAHSIAYAIGSLRTFTASSQFKKELSDSQKKLIDYEIALNETSIISITDEQGLISFVNKKFEQTYGIKAEQMIGSKHTLVNSKYHSEEFWKQMWQTITAGQTWYGKIKNVTIKGEEKWFESIIYPFLDRTGKPYQFLGIQRDISDSIALQEKVEMVNRLVDSAQVPIYSFGLDGEIYSWNSASETLFGYSETEIVGKNFSSYLTEEQQDEMAIILSKIKKGESISSIEVERNTKDNKTIYLSLSLSPIRNHENEVIGAAAIAKDITRIKQAELMAFNLNTKLITREREFQYLNDLSNLNNDEALSITQYLNNFVELMNLHWSNHQLSNAKVIYKGKTYQSNVFTEQKHLVECSNNLSKTENFIIQIHHPADYIFSKSEQYILNLSCAWIANSIKFKEYGLKLRERIKELNTLQNTVKISETYSHSTQDLLEKLCTEIPNGFQFPELVCTCISYAGKSFMSEPIIATGESLEYSFETIDKNKVTILVQYKEPFNDEFSRAFMLEEEILLKEVSDHLKSILNQQILHENLKVADYKIQKIVEYVDAAVVLLDETDKVVFSNTEKNEIIKDVFGIEIKNGVDLKHVLNIEYKTILNKLRSEMLGKEEIQYTYEHTFSDLKKRSFDIKLIKIEPDKKELSDLLILIKEVSHLKDREEEINDLVNLLKDLNFITSYEISHELHKLQSIVELAQDLDFVDSDLKEIFSTSKETFSKTDAGVKKLINRINIPLQKELSIANSLKRIEKVILIDQDELSTKISLRILEKHFDPMKLLSFTNIEDAIAFFKSEGDNGNNIILLEPNLNEKSGWEFLFTYESKNFLSPVILMGSNPDSSQKQRAMSFPMVKNFIQKPINNETALGIKSKKIIIWNN